MSTSAIGQTVLYKTATGYVPAVITRAYADSAGATAIDASTALGGDTTIKYADLLLLGLQPVRLPLVKKDVTGNANGNITVAATTALSSIASVLTGTWFVYV